jgi:hypothetical protein
MYLEPTRGKATVGAVIMLVITAGIAVVALVYRTDRWPDRWRPEPDVPDKAVLGVAGVMVLFALICLISAIVNGRRWHMARAIERLSDDASLAATMPPAELPPPAPRARVIAPLRVDVVTPRKLPRPRVKWRTVTRDHNVVGGRPLRIAYLRLFDNRPRTRTFVEGAWREFGYVYLLRSAASVTPAEYRAAHRSGDFAGMFIDCPERLLSRLDGVHTAPLGKGRHKFTDVAPSALRVRDKYGCYPMAAMLCHGRFWKEAIDLLLARVDLIALDLSGFTPANAATRHELQRVVDRFPIEGVVFLADQRSNHKFLVDQIQQAWAQMAEGSPNAGPQPRQALVAITDYLASTQSSSAGGAGGSQGPVQIRLVARRNETRRLAAYAAARQSRLAA